MPIACCLATVKSPKSVKVPLVSKFADSITFETPGLLKPPADIALTLLPKPVVVPFTASKLPKFVALPKLFILIACTVVP